MHWVHKADFEVSGFGKVRRRDDGHFEVVDAYLLKQEGTGTTTDIDEQALAKLLYTTKDVEGDLRWWWHSHVKMNVFWSGTDKETIMELGAQGWIVATVFNQKNEYRSALAYKAEYDITSPWGKVLKNNTEMVDDIDMEVSYDVDVEQLKQWDDEFTTNVTEKKYTPRQPGQGYVGRGSELVPIDQSLLTGDPAWDNYVYAEMEKEASRFNAKQEEDELDRWLKDPGLLGYGLMVEARALGMTAESYEKKLNRKDMRTLNQMEDKLLYLEKKEKLS